MQAYRRRGGGADIPISSGVEIASEVAETGRGNMHPTTSAPFRGIQLLWHTRRVPLHRQPPPLFCNRGATWLRALARARFPEKTARQQPVVRWRLADCRCCWLMQWRLQWRRTAKKMAPTQIERSERC
jgi:hypothetical protein